MGERGRGVRRETKSEGGDGKDTSQQGWGRSVCTQLGKMLEKIPEKRVLVFVTKRKKENRFGGGISWQDMSPYPVPDFFLTEKSDVPI